MGKSAACQAHRRSGVSGSAHRWEASCITSSNPSTARGAPTAGPASPSLRAIDELEESGLLRKVRGGASVESSAQFESDFRYRQTLAREEKQRVERHRRDAEDVLGQEQPQAVGVRGRAGQVEPPVGGVVAADAGPRLERVPRDALVADAAFDDVLFANDDRC